MWCFITYERNAELGLKQVGLFATYWWGILETAMSLGCGFPALTRMDQIAALYEEWLDDLGQRGLFLAKSDGKGLDSNGAAGKPEDECLQESIVHLVQPVGVDLLHLQRGLGHVEVDVVVCDDLCVISNPAYQLVGYPWRATTAPGYFHGSIVVYGHVDDAGRTLDDNLQDVRVVIVKAQVKQES